MEVNEGNNVDESINKAIEEQFLEIENFKEFYDKFSQNLKDAVQTSSNLIKTNNDLNFYLSFPGFVKCIKSQNGRLLKIISSLLKFECLKKPNLICSSDLDVGEKTDLIVDSNDQLIERLGIQLDEIEGLRKKTETELNLTTIHTTNRNINTSWNKETGMVQKTAGNSTINNKKSTNKPQLLFEDKIDNSNLPFVPKIRVKLNAIEPLSEIFGKLDKIEINDRLFEDYPELLINPYTKEIEAFEVNDEYLREKEPIKPLKLDETELEYIDTIEGLNNLKQTLSAKNRDKIKEIAVDLEHHSYRSYLGFTCLMQISTRCKDYIIDTIKLRNNLRILNDIFTDSSLLKVFHGADSDIEWLQKDFGIYVVNMFDTGQASRLLQYPHFSLSYLLKRFCDVQAQKQFQMSDWRQRPLNMDLINYAREDTHYLLFIYDVLRNDLIKKQQLKNCYEKTKLICKKVYKKPIFYSNSYLSLSSQNEHLNGKQLKALELLYEWRDRIAREHDESSEYVLKNHQLLKISQLLPREIYGILALCNPVSHLVESNLHQIHEIVLKAREHKIENQQQSVDDDNKQTQNISNNLFIHLPLYDPNSVINCPHDSAHFNVSDMEVSLNDTNGNQLKLTDLLIKPNKIEPMLPENLIFENQIRNLLVDNFKELKAPSENHKDKRVKRKIKLIKKIDLIKNSMKNPFEKYLPFEFRRENEPINESEKWNLLKKSIVDTNQPVESNGVLVQPKVEDLPDTNLIPLKLQLRQQQNESNAPNPRKTNKKMKKMLKELEMNAAIEEHNASKEEESLNAIGINDDTTTNAISANLAKIAAAVRASSENEVAATTASNTNIQQFDYESQNLNEMFNKNQKFKNNSKDIYDPTSRLKNVKFGRVSKKRNFNAAASISRSKNNQNATFKK